MKRVFLAIGLLGCGFGINAYGVQEGELPLNKELISQLEKKCGEKAEEKFDSLESLVAYANNHKEKQGSIQLAIDAFSENNSGNLKLRKKEVLFSLRNWLLAFSLDTEGKLNASKDAQKARSLLLLFLASKSIQNFHTEHKFANICESKETFQEWLPRILEKINKQFPKHAIIQSLNPNYNNNQCFGWYTLQNKLTLQEKPELYKKDALKGLCFAYQLLSEHYRKVKPAKHGTALLYAIFAMHTGGDKLIERNLSYIRSCFPEHQWDEVDNEDQDLDTIMKTITSESSLQNKNKNQYQVLSEILKQFEEATEKTGDLDEKLFDLWLKTASELDLKIVTTQEENNEGEDLDEAITTTASKDEIGSYYYPKSETSNLQKSFMNSNYQALEMNRKLVYELNELREHCDLLHGKLRVANQEILTLTQQLQDTSLQMQKETSSLKQQLLDASIQKQQEILELKQQMRNKESEIASLKDSLEEAKTNEKTPLIKKGKQKHFCTIL